MFFNKSKSLSMNNITLSMKTFLNHFSTNHFNVGIIKNSLMSKIKNMRVNLIKFPVSWMNVKIKL